jgi:SAM-dependent methyltransferase
MNTKIFSLLTKKLQESFKLPKYANISFDRGTEIMTLPWTPARFKKFKESIETELSLIVDFSGTLSDVVALLDKQYSHRFFSEIWKPRTSEYQYTGWNIVDVINKQNPSSVLDVGCGFNPFKGRIQNLIGIDPYNDCADYQVDILEYKVKPESHDCIIAFGSINFNGKDEIEERFSHCVSLLKPGGSFYLRANPGIAHKTGPYVDVFPWTFEVANEFAVKYNLRLITFKHDNCERLYFSYEKLG